MLELFFIKILCLWFIQIEQKLSKHTVVNQIKFTLIIGARAQKINSFVISIRYFYSRQLFW